MGRGSSNGRPGTGGGGTVRDTAFVNLTRVPLPGGGFNLISNGQRVGLIDSSGGEYRYAGTFQGVQIGASANGGNVYVSNLRRNVDTTGWTVTSVWKASTGRVVVTLRDPSNPLLSVSVDKDKIR